MLYQLVYMVSNGSRLKGLGEQFTEAKGKLDFLETGYAMIFLSITAYKLVSKLLTLCDPHLQTSCF